MALTISLANRPRQIDAVFKVREQIFAEQGRRGVGGKAGQAFDQFDTYPTTTNMVVSTHDDQVVGSMRLALDSEMGIPSDAEFDFRSVLPPDATILDCSLYGTVKEVRSPTVTSGMMHMAGYFAYSRQVTHVTALMSPDVAKMVKWARFDPVGPEFFNPVTEQRVCPLVLQVDRLNDSFMSFARKNAMLDFVQEYRRSFYSPGEHIIRAGEEGDCAYVLINGRAKAILPGQEPGPFEIAEGEMFGEIALLTDETRSADVVASTEVQVMELDKEVFLQFLNAYPEKALELLRSMSVRMRNVIERMNGPYV